MDKSDCIRRLLLFIAAFSITFLFLSYQHLSSKADRYQLERKQFDAYRQFKQVPLKSKHPYHKLPSGAIWTPTSAPTSRSPQQSKTNESSVTISPLKSTSHVASSTTDAVSQHYETTRPMDTVFIDSHFNDLKAIIRQQRQLTSYWNHTDKMMRRRRPLINSTSWRLHAPSGYNYSRADLLQLGSDGLAVPNVAHFVLPFGHSELKFHHRVCILSCVWIMRPRLLFLWYAKLPTGSHWEALKRNLTESGLWDSTVVLAHRDVPSDIYGLPAHKLEHKSDLMRLEAVIEFGGAYFDLDVITLKSLRPLRRFDFTIGRQSADGLCNGVFLAAPNSTFLVLWHLAYQVFDQYKWSALSVNLPHFMCAAEAFRHLCHVEEDSMDQPTWNKYKLIYNQQRKWPWRQKNYVMHLWYRFHPVQYNMSSIRTVDSMLGDMFRYVLFGNESSPN